MLSETSYLFLFQNKILKVKKTKEKITFFFPVLPENLWIYKWEEQLNFYLKLLFKKQKGFKILIPLCGVFSYVNKKTELGVIKVCFKGQPGAAV